MQVHICTPYSVEKNLGRAYNEVMRMVPEDTWVCLMDYDTQFLTPDAGKILHEYAARFPQAAILTCFTNRISPLSRKQLLNGTVSENTDIKYHINIAEHQKQFLYQATPIHKDISGFLMMINKNTWKEFPFDESGKCLGVDTYYGRMIRAAGKQILRLDGLYVFHAYRLIGGINNKSHLL